MQIINNHEPHKWYNLNAHGAAAYDGTIAVIRPATHLQRLKLLVGFAGHAISIH